MWLFLAVGVGAPGGFVLGGGTHADGGVWPDGVEPVHPLGGGDLDGVDVLPRALECVVFLGLGEFFFP